MENSDLKNEYFNLLIASHLTGSATEDELKKLEEWINQSHENLIYFNKLKDSWMLSCKVDKESSSRTEKGWDILMTKLADGDSDRGSASEDPHNNIFALTKYMKLAASWILVFALGSLMTWLFISLKKSDKSAKSERIIEISTPLGARSMIIMPDSTVIWMNAGTDVKYSQDYGKKTRSLSMTGEAYFKVAKDSEHPFIVNAQGILVQALGTRFNVKAYAEEKTISATLEEGKIEIKVPGMQDEKESIMLKERDKLIYHKETRETEKYTESAEDKTRSEDNQPVKPRQISLLSNVRTELYTSWKDPRWIIYREPLNTLAPMLERRYNLKFIFDDYQLRNYKFTGIVENETIDQILNALKLTAPLDYKISRDTVRLVSDSKSGETFNRILKRK